MQFFDAHPTGVAADPAGQSSIKAVRIQKPGFCTNEIFYASILEGIASSSQPAAFSLNIQNLITTNLISKLCPSVDELLFHNLTIVPLQRHNYGEPGDSRAQLFVNGNVHLQGSNFGCNMYVAVLYNIVLDDNGALVIGVARDSNDVQQFALTDIGGGGCSDISILSLPGANTLITYLVTDLLPSLLTAQTLGAQALPPSALSSLAGGLFPGFGVGSCALTDGIPWVYGDQIIAQLPPTSCDLARRSACNFIRLGFINQGFSPNGTAPDWWLASDFDFSVSDPGCDEATENPSDDEKRLQRMFEAVNETAPTYWPNEQQTLPALRYWRCNQSNTATTAFSFGSGPTFADAVTGEAACFCHR